jgi:hypothetical protein
VNSEVEVVLVGLSAPTESELVASHHLLECAANRSTNHECPYYNWKYKIMIICNFLVETNCMANMREDLSIGMASGESSVRNCFMTAECAFSIEFILVNNGTKFVSV